MAPPPPGYRGQRSQCDHTKPGGERRSDPARARWGVARQLRGIPPPPTSQAPAHAARTNPRRARRCTYPGCNPLAPVNCDDLPVKVMLVCTLATAAVAGAVALPDERDYRARAFVIQVPSDLGGDKGLELARTDHVLRHAVLLSGVKQATSAWLRRHSRAELTSRLDLAFTVEVPDADQAAALATGYAKAFRRAIPDDEGLPVRGRGAGEAQPELGPLGWTVLGGLAGLGLGAAIAVIQNGLRKGSMQTPRAASRACAPPT
jgi:hypothetical protein